jgi:hypothetical protein
MQLQPGIESSHKDSMRFASSKLLKNECSFGAEAKLKCAGWTSAL